MPAQNVLWRNNLHFLAQKCCFIQNNDTVKSTPVRNESIAETYSKARFSSHMTGSEAAVMALVQRSKELKEEGSQKLLERICHNLLS